MLELRPYQQESVDGVREELREQIQAGVDPSVLLESPTGSGKTAMASDMAHSCINKRGTLAFLCHRKELLDQTALTFEKAGLDFGFIAAGYPSKRARVQLCSVQSLSNRIERIEAPRLVIWDEAHHVGAATWANIRERWKKSAHVGLTATPCRLDGKGLGTWFNAMVPGPSVAELMRDGYLSTFDAYAPTMPDLKGVRKVAGDYSRKGLASALDKGEILGGIVDHWSRIAKGKKTIGFAVSVDHSLHIVDAFRQAGIAAEHLDAKTPKDERRLVLQRFARGKIEVLFNVELFGEGFDLAANSGMDVNIEAVILARPTASLGLHLQQVGRALRPKPDGSPAIVLDHAGNLIEHGFPQDERTWSLEDQPKKPSQSSNFKTCPKCFAIQKVHVSECGQCGHLFVSEGGGREIEEVEGSLEQIASGAATSRELQKALRARRGEVLRARSLPALLALQRQRGLPDGWAEDVMRKRAEKDRERSSRRH